MSRKSIYTEEGQRYFRECLADPAGLPFSFVYGDVCFHGLESDKNQGTGAEGVETEVTETECGTRVVHTMALDENMKVRVDALLNREFGETEYTVWFENTGKAPSKVLKDVYVLDTNFEGDAPVLRGNLGDHDNWYAAYEHDLKKGDKYFLSRGGRATHIVFPYFDLVHGDGGTMIALGWAGTWEARFACHDDKTRVKAKTDVDLQAVLMPGEKVRTGLVVMLPYKTRDYDNATNLWREWFMQYNLPRADADGSRLKPFSTSCFAGDTGLPNSDGSISERDFTWKPTLDKLVEEKVVPDFRWFDAGWYYDPAGNTVETEWWSTIGSWKLDHCKWPGKSFLESNEACHNLGMKVLVWFEPERVTHVEDLVKNHGYKPEWAIGEGNSRTNNLGDPECLAWTLKQITDMMEENGVDAYREDNNSDPGFAWPCLDTRESKMYSCPRKGIAENKCICGHYALWDGIIAYCAAHNKCTFVDSCASGGGRNDIESMRRGIPFMRSDYDRTSSSMRLSQTSTLCRWIPFHGSATKEVAFQLDTSTGAGSNAYVSRASLLPVYNYGEAFTHNPELDYDLMRRNINEWRSISHLLVRDFYVLTPWHHEYSRESWTAFAYDAPETGEALLLAFRMEEAAADTFTLRLPFAQADREYRLENADTGEVSTISGATLLEGFDLTLDQPKSSAFIRIQRL